MTRARRDEGGAPTSSLADRASPGTIIAAFVRARLLGIKILTIDARIVHVDADAVPDVAPVAARAKAIKPLIEGATARRDGRRADLAYAIRLLEESTKDMDEVRGAHGVD